MPDNLSEVPLPGERRHQPELDGIRGIAILLVMGSHAAGVLGVLPESKLGILLQNLLAPGWGGVDLFFVLSGFLITGILLRAKTSVHYFQSFYARRVLRIFPIYYLALIGTLVVQHFFPGIKQFVPQRGMERLSYFIYLQNIPGFWQGMRMMTGVWGGYWSLAVEEQFYTVWPLMVRLLSGRAMMIVCMAGFLLGLPVRLLLMQWYFGVQVGAIQFTLCRADGLFMGASIALYMHLWKRNVPMLWIQIAGACGAAIIAYVAVFFPDDLTSDGHLYTVGITAFALLGGALVAWSQHHPRWLQRALSWNVLRQAGKYSYGMYVYHLFLFIGIRVVVVHYFPDTDGELHTLPALGVMAVATLASWLIAKLSYDLFEVRFLALKRFFPESEPLEKSTIRG